MNPLDIPTVRLDELPDLDKLPTQASILDVREPHEWSAGHIPGARHIPMNSVPATLAHEPGEIGPDRRIYVMCAMGGRSAQVTAWLVGNGYDAVNVLGGMHGWQDAGRALVSENGQPPTVV